VSDAAEIRAHYRAAFAQIGEQVTLRRETVSPPVEAAGVWARLVGFTPDELASGVDQGERKVLLLAEDVETSGFPLPLLKDDLIVLAGDTKLGMIAIDDCSRRVAGMLMAYEIRATGF
jgi:hypothetical protein